MTERERMAAAIREYAGEPTMEWSEWEMGWHKGLMKAAVLIEQGDV